MTMLLVTLVVVGTKPVLPLGDCLHGKYLQYEKHLGKPYESKKISGFEVRRYKVPSNSKIAFVELTDWKSKDGTVNVISLVFKKGGSVNYKDALDVVGIDNLHSSSVSAFPNDQTVKIILGLKAGKFQTGSVGASSSGVTNPKGGDFSATWYSKFDAFQEGAVLQIESPPPLQ